MDNEQELDVGTKIFLNICFVVAAFFAGKYAAILYHILSVE